MDFEQRLHSAVQRGLRRSDARAQEAAARALSEDELKSLHTKYRLQFSEHIERCMQKLPDHFPGFQYETVFGERGWGGACSRDDFARAQDGKRGSLYSRLEMTIRPYSQVGVVELVAKGAIRNKETFNRKHFKKIADVDEEEFTNLVDHWVLEYAEQYAASL